MSGRKYSRKNNQIRDVISVEDVILDYVIDNRWKDYQKFARKLTERILENQPLTRDDLRKIVENLNHPFFNFNGITREHFLNNFPLADLLEHSRRLEPLSVKQAPRVRKKSKRKTISKKIRLLILERDGYKCCLCGRTAKETKLEVDHKVPVAKGGTDSLNNLWTLCIDCNRGKTDLSLETN
jgi:5-methylcytosine-specific restriction protein A